MINPFKRSLFCFVVLSLLAAGASFHTAFADDSIGALEKEIQAKNDEIRQLEAVAEQYRQTIATTADEAKTLAAEVKRINNAITKLQNDIQLTTKKIQKTSLEIKSLKSQIADAEQDISERRKHLAELIRSLAASDREQPLVVLLRDNALSDFFNRIEATVKVQETVGKILSDLHSLKEQLSGKKSDSETKVVELKRQSNQLADKKELQVFQQGEKKKVLSETKSREQIYRELLAENERRRKALEEEIEEAENQLRFTLDPSSLPQKISGVLLWPLPTASKPTSQCGHASVWVFLTQCFGQTAFARAGGYNGSGHNGIDLRAENGTEVYAAEDGLVRGTGDTDAGCRKASYGKWILIDQDNNLTTLYSHLSLIKATAGQRVARGDLIGYSGQTGYATGPHLHFSVFAQNAVEIGQLKSKVCGRIMTLPLSAPSGYLDPLDYL